MVHIPENSQNSLVPYSAYNSPVHTKSDDSFVTILTNSELHCATPHTPSYPLPLHTHSTPSAKATTPPTQLLRSAGYTHSVASPPVHPPGKHLHSTTRHRFCSRLYPSMYRYSNHYTKYLLIYLLVCMFACSWCIVIGAFVSSRGGQICKSTPGGGARSQFRELSFPLRRISTASSLNPFDA